MLILLMLVVLFHILVVVQVIPYTIVWAGKINSISEMQAMESVSIAINVLLILVLLLRGNYIETNIPNSFLNFIIWIYVVLFAANTIGNLYSESKLELYLFTFLTFVSAILCLRIVLEKTKPDNQ